MTQRLKLSNSDKRNKAYNKFLESCRSGNVTVDGIIKFGCRLMRNNKLHHHFFGEYNIFGSFSLFATAKYLAHFALASRCPPVHKTGKDKLTEQEAAGIIALFERRIAERIPVEYITKESSYAGFKFYVNENVLVPRSLMSARFKDFLNGMQWENNKVLDLCAGSGCIGITLALLDPRIQVDLADISPDALEVARINIERYSLGDRVRCVQTDCFENIQGKYDLIITNPPYVSARNYNNCPDEFLNEPKIALASGTDGLDMISRILKRAKSYLNANGTLIAEVGLYSAKRLKKKYPKSGFQWFKYRRPNGKEGFFDDHSVLLCRRPQLPDI
ncbi:MAG: 50S ribosomal protein L3 N(5)-glutamine methyltransferase [Alphaproteobacteria bacterium]|nr:50S ribosomal protein L3 N(5)-glutamine methyltransferase [Alphaproteobacteria bacterium]